MQHGTARTAALVVGDTEVAGTGNHLTGAGAWHSGDVDGLKAGS